MFEYNKFQINSLQCNGCFRPIKDHLVRPDKDQIVSCPWGSFPFSTVLLSNNKIAIVQHSPETGYYYQRMKPFSNIGNLLAHIKTPHTDKEKR